MTAADKLRDLHAAISDASAVRQLRGMEEIDTAWMLLPEIAAVIEAAELQMDGWPDLTAPVLRDALAALNARLDGAA